MSAQSEQALDIANFDAAMEVFGSNLRGLMAARGETPVSLGRQVGLKPRLVESAMQAHWFPNIEQQERMAKALECPLVWLTKDRAELDAQFRAQLGQLSSDVAHARQRWTELEAERNALEKQLDGRGW